MTAQVLLLPEDAEQSAESALWSLLSLANVYFWLYQDTSYFAAASSETPLLHLWSLGVEEQFYIFWPLILIFAYRPTRIRLFFVTTALIALASFLLGEFAGHCGNNWVSRVLALKPLVWVGLISYSAYLWHWPLLAFFRYGHVEVGALAGSAVFALTLLLAWITYLYVERPARCSKASAAQIFLRQYVFPASALAFVALGAMYIDGYGFRWLSDNYKTRLTAIRQQTLPAYQYDYVCQRQKIAQEDAQDERCVVGFDSGNPPQVILWGDSNAAQYVGMVGAFARKAGFRFRNLAIGACPPIDSDAEEFVSATRLSDCRDSAEIMRRAVNAFEIVIISASWTSYQERSAKFLDAFFDTALALAQKGRLVILIGKAPVISSYERV